jgi:hypothetical protein
VGRVLYFICEKLAREIIVWDNVIKEIYVLEFLYKIEDNLVNVIKI